MDAEPRRRRSAERAHKGPAPIPQLPRRRVVNPYPPMQLLSAGQVEAIHEASMHILENFGIEVMSPRALSLFEKAGAKPATTPEEWIETTAKLTKRPDQFGIALTNVIADSGEWWFQLQNFCLPFDGKWAEGKTPLANSPEVVKGLELWKSLYEAGVPQGTAQSAIMKLAADGRVAQAFGVNPTLVVLRATNPDIYPDLLSAAPPWASRRSLDRIHPLIALKGKNSEGAKEFIQFVMTPDVMADLMITNLYVMPPYDLAAKSEKFRAFLADKPWVTGFNEAKQVSPIDVMGDFAFADDQFGRIIMQNFQSALRPGGSVKTAMDGAQRQLEALATRL